MGVSDTPTYKSGVAVTRGTPSAGGEATQARILAASEQRIEPMVMGVEEKRCVPGGALRKGLPKGC